MIFLVIIQYRSNVSYHRLARNETRIARNETRIARNETRLAGNKNCLARNFSFLAMALQVPLSLLTVAHRKDCRVWRKSLSRHVSYRWFFPWDKHRRCATGVRYFLVLSGQFLFYMYWSTWWAFVLSVHLSFKDKTLYWISTSAPPHTCKVSSLDWLTCNNYLDHVFTCEATLRTCNLR